MWPIINDCQSDTVSCNIFPKHIAVSPPVEAIPGTGLFDLSLCRFKAPQHWRALSIAEPCSRRLSSPGAIPGEAALTKYLIVNYYFIWKMAWMPTFPLEKLLNK